LSGDGHDHVAKHGTVDCCADDLLSREHRRLFTDGLLDQCRPLPDLPAALGTRLFDAMPDLRFQPCERIPLFVVRGVELARRGFEHRDGRRCNGLLHEPAQVVV
jgi:hypothetical protein